METVGRIPTSVCSAQNVRLDLSSCELRRVSSTTLQTQRGHLTIVARRTSGNFTAKQQRKEEKTSRNVSSWSHCSPRPSLKLFRIRAEDEDAAETALSKADDAVVTETEGLPSTEEKPVSSQTQSAEEIGKALSELRAKASSSEPDFWKGVAQETQLIEWPPFSKVLRTTGVVMAMITGSSVVLLTVNAILSAGSDYIFHAAPIQDVAKSLLDGS